MRLIAHRGNINGKNKLENEPNYILETLKTYDCEIDVWFINNNWFLGHDNAQYKIEKEFLYNKGLWIHCKNVDALYQLIGTNLTFFFHDKDLVTLTSNNLIWTYPGQQLTNKSIAVLPETVHYTEEYLNKSFGICSDLIKKYEKI